MRRKAAVRALLCLMAAQVVAVVVLAGVGELQCRSARGDREVGRTLVSELLLTDLALWSEAGYCRHPSQADRFAPYADHPSAMEHFPAGSMVPPPNEDVSARLVKP